MEYEIKVIEKTAKALNEWAYRKPQKILRISMAGYKIEYRPNNMFFVLLGFLFLGMGVSMVHLIMERKGYVPSMDTQKERVKTVYFYGLDGTEVNTPDEEFVVKKQLLISSYLIRWKVNRIDQLPTVPLMELNREISNLFSELIIGKIPIPDHVRKFFVDTTELDKLETVLMDQAKFNIPASIKLAQAALETGWGKKVPNNNYFGIKDRTKETEAHVTTEFFTPEQVERNEDIILSKSKVVLQGRVFYKCMVKDSFTGYSTPWESFRAHSIFLSNNSRYAPLFVKGKNYKDWAERIGSVEHGGVGYATSPVYGEQLTNIIERYKLYLLDN